MHGALDRFPLSTPKELENVNQKTCREHIRQLLMLEFMAEL